MNINQGEHEINKSAYQKAICEIMKCIIGDEELECLKNDAIGSYNNGGDAKGSVKKHITPKQQKALSNYSVKQIDDAITIFLQSRMCCNWAYASLESRGIMQISVGYTDVNKLTDQ